MEQAKLSYPSRAVSSVTFGDSTRYVILLVTMLALIFASANTLLFNVTVICMTEDTVVDGNLTQTEIFDQNEKGVLYSAVAVGTLISCLVITKLIQVLGGR